MRIPLTLCDEKKLEVIHLVFHSFEKAIDYCTKRLADTLTKYEKTDSKYNGKMAKRMNVLMIPHTFHLFNSISIIYFLKIFKLASDTTGAPEGEALCLFHYFMNKTSSSVLNAYLSTDGTGEKYVQLANGEK